MDYSKLWRIVVYFAIAIIQCLSYSQTQVHGPQCCWNAVQANFHVSGVKKQDYVANEEDCKDLCCNNVTCIGVDWNTDENSCWFQMEQGDAFPGQHIYHWRKAFCTVGNECSPHCWNPVQPNSKFYGGIQQVGVANEEDCKALCINNGTCIGVDWNTNDHSCWFQMTESLIYDHEDLNHWSLTNCTQWTDDCVSYCWRPLRNNSSVVGGLPHSEIKDENRCKLLCSNTPTCTGVDWDMSCYLIFAKGQPLKLTGIHHWDIERILGTDCLTTPTQTTIHTSTVRMTKDDASPTASITSNSMAPVQSSPLPPYSSEGTTGCMTGIIVLAVLLGLCIFTIFGLVINTIRIGRQLHLKSDTKSDTDLGDNYEGLRRSETKVKSEDGTYTDLVPGNPKEAVYEQTS